jgi:uncharacterized protein YjiS (DUF1127 family)
MTTATDFAEDFRATPRLDARPHALMAAWQAFRRAREERRALAQIARLGPRLIRDIGLDPEQVRGQVGGWDDLRPTGLLFQSPGRPRG